MRLSSTISTPLRVSYAANHSDARGLGKAALEGRVYIYVASKVLARSVTFRVDGCLWNTDLSAPYNLVESGTGLARSLDLSLLPPGRHRVVASIVTVRGSRQTVAGTFTIVDSASMRYR